MMKNNKRTLILTSVVILLPIAAGLFLWDVLPDHMTTHWGADGNADRWSGKAFGVFGPPLILLAFQWLCIILDTVITKDKNIERNRKAFRVALWIIPFLSLFVNSFMYASALGMDIRPDLFVSIMIGLMFIALGNYLPKVRQNSTLGIKIPWTLSSEENWNRTHRMAGKLWVAGGVLLLFTIFLPSEAAAWTWLIVLVILAAVPTIYSYYLHRTLTCTTDARIDEISDPVGTFSKWAKVISLVFVVFLLIFIAFLMFTGNVEVQYSDTSFTIEATYWDDLTVDYTAVDSIEYRESGVPGVRIGGFGSPRLALGNFSNDEYGRYTRYTYTQSTACVVLTSGDKILVLNGADDAATRAIYEELSARIPG